MVFNIRTSPVTLSLCKTCQEVYAFSVPMGYPVDNGLYSEASSFCFYRIGAVQQGRLMGTAPAYVQALVVVSGGGERGTASALLLPYYYSVHIQHEC